jgi:hypothetical protein
MAINIDGNAPTELSSSLQGGHVAVFYRKNDCFGRVIQASLALGRAFGRVETTSNGGIYDSFDSIVE